jgi:hypothetical protein
MVEIGLFIVDIAILTMQVLLASRPRAGRPPLIINGHGDGGLEV